MIKKIPGHFRYWSTTEHGRGIHFRVYTDEDSSLSVSQRTEDTQQIMTQTIGRWAFFIVKSPDARKRQNTHTTHDTSRRVASSAHCRPPRRTRSVCFVFIARGAISTPNKQPPYPTTSRLRFPKGAARRGDSTLCHRIAKSIVVLLLLRKHKDSWRLVGSPSLLTSLKQRVIPISRRFLVLFRGSPPLLV
jgi:hypothetical protein